MKLRLAILMLPLVLLAASDKKSSTKPATLPRKAAAAPAGLPAGAKPVDANTWRYTSADGKKWLYRKTPFGMTKLEEKPPAPEPQLPAGMKGLEEGDSVRFERPGPFGNIRWTKKKDQLNDLERRVWERDRPKEEKAQR